MGADGSALAEGGSSDVVGAARSSVVGGSSVLAAAGASAAVVGADRAGGLGAGVTKACLPDAGGTAGVVGRAPGCARSGALAQASTVAPSKRRLAIRIVNVFVDRKTGQLLAAKAAHAP